MIKEPVNEIEQQKRQQNDNEGKEVLESDCQDPKNQLDAQY